MGEPGPGNPRMSGLIIDTPSLQSLKKRFALSFLTFVFWGVWFYLWMPLVTILAWSFGIYLGFEHMIVLGGWEGLGNILWVYLLTIFFLGVITIGWARYNKFRFGNKKRRGDGGKVTHEDLMAFFVVGDDILKEARASKRVVIHFDEKGSIVNLCCSHPFPTIEDGDGKADDDTLTPREPVRAVT